MINNKMKELIFADKKAIKQEIEHIKSRIDLILKESSEKHDCTFVINLPKNAKSGMYGLHAFLDGNKYRITNPKLE